MPSACIIAPNYFPESNAAAKRITALAEHLARNGWSVEVVTLLPHYPQNRIYEGYDRRSPDVRVENGVKVVRLRPWIVPRGNLPVRLMAETLFAAQAARRVLAARAALVLTSVPFMFQAPLAWLASRITGSAFVVDVRDLTWHYPRASGKRTFGADRLIDRLMRATVARADALTATTAAQVDYFGPRPEASLTVPNGVSEEAFRLLSAIDVRAPRNDRPQVLYAGLFGYNQNLEVVLRCAALLPDVRFLLVGDGPEREKLVRLVGSERLSNVEIRPYVPFETLVGHYRDADVLVSHVRDHEVFRYMQSAKVWEYMATGRPLVHGGVGASATQLEARACGVAIAPDDPAAMAAAIRGLIDDPERAVRLARNARRIVREEYRRETIFAGMESALRELVTRRERT